MIGLLLLVLVVLGAAAVAVWRVRELHRVPEQPYTPRHYLPRKP